MSRRVPNDPGRRERILDAALDVIAEVGVHATTHRRIAAAASVPLGSVTYYFAGVQEIIELAFDRLSVRMSAHYRTLLENATTREEAERAVVDLVCGPEYMNPREMVLLIEMYAYASHSAAAAETARTWLHRSRASLSLHFPDHVARALDVLVEGWPIQRTFERSAPDRALVTATVRAVVAGLEATSERSVPARRGSDESDGTT